MTPASQSTVTQGCRLCGRPSLQPLIDLGQQYLSDFRDDDLRPPQAPLRLMVCDQCWLPQLSHTAPPEWLYHPGYSFKSGVNEAVRANLAAVVEHALNFRAAFKVTQSTTPALAWLDIASNDGTLLSHIPSVVWREGIDPLPQYADEARQHANRITVGFFDPKHYRATKFDVITAVSMFYDLDDPHEFIEEILQILARTGILVVQQNYLGDMLRNLSIDNVSHEHLTYWSLSTMERLLTPYKLEVVDVAADPINGGCFRTIIARTGAYQPTPAVDQWRRLEVARSLDNMMTYNAFAHEASVALVRIGIQVDQMTRHGDRVQIYGASTRGAVLWQAAGFDLSRVQAVVDRNPAKVGRRMSAIGLPIISEEAMRADPPDCLLVGPWWLVDQFATREQRYIMNGGRMLVPLPELRYIDIAHTVFEENT